MISSIDMSLSLKASNIITQPVQNMMHLTHMTHSKKKVTPSIYIHVTMVYRMCWANLTAVDFKFTIYR